jgi:hypothetical protein|tara:strand:- start:444 stop:659 length:216 start_codon:yes stop_codon:yes gene_type:complete
MSTAHSEWSEKLPIRFDWLTKETWANKPMLHNEIMLHSSDFFIVKFKLKRALKLNKIIDMQPLVLNYCSFI